MKAPPGNPCTDIASVIKPSNPQYTVRDRSGALRCTVAR